MQCPACGSLLNANGLPIVSDLALVLVDVDRVSFRDSFTSHRVRDGLAIIAAASQNMDSTPQEAER